MEKGKSSERGSETLEFAVALPFLIVLMYAIGAFAWAFWSQAVADVVTARAIREATVDRGNGSIVGFGQAFYGENLGSLSNAQTAGAIGDLQVNFREPYRVISFRLDSSQGLNLGDFSASFEWGGGGLGRLWDFFDGPPDLWE